MNRVECDLCNEKATKREILGLGIRVILLCDDCYKRFDLLKTKTLGSNIPQIQKEKSVK